MSGNRVAPRALPVGLVKFHRHRFLNYQLNRAHALGFADREELRDAASTIRSLGDAALVFIGLSERAESSGRLRHATSYLRLAEFFTPKRAGAGVPIYVRYRNLFDRAFADSSVVRHDVPYGATTLPAYHLPAVDSVPRGTGCCTVASTR